MNLFSSQFIFSDCLSHGQHQDKAACPFHAHRRQARARNCAFYTAASKLHCTSGLTCWCRKCMAMAEELQGSPPGARQNGLFIFFTAGTLTVINVVILLQLLLPVRILPTCIDVECLWRKQISVTMTRSVGNASHGPVPHSGVLPSFIA